MSRVFVLGDELARHEELVDTESNASGVSDFQCSSVVALVEEGNLIEVIVPPSFVLESEISLLASHGPNDAYVPPYIFNIILI